MKPPERWHHSATDNDQLQPVFVLGVIIINDSLELRYEPLKSFTDKSRLASGLGRRRGGCLQRAAAITVASAVRYYEYLINN